jgi:hypothetical protein
MVSVPDPKIPSHKSRAHALRKAERAGQALHESDQLWLSDYDAKVERNKATPKAIAGEVGASRSAATRSVRFELDEAQQAEAIGTGPTAAAIAAGAALQAKEEGRRLDSLTMHSIDALKEAVGVYKDICLMLHQRTEILEQTHVEMLMSVRAHFIAATEAEGALAQRDAEQKPEDQLLMGLIAQYLNVPPQQLPRPHAPKTKPNGARPPPGSEPKP